MAVRLLSYMMHLWDNQRREWKDRKLPEEQRRLYPIIPLVFYTGTEAWSAPIRLTEIMDVPAELERFVPQWETLFLNLHRTPPEMLTQFATAVGWALRVLQAEREPLAQLERVLQEAMAGLEGLSEEQLGQWTRVAWYFLLLFYHRRSDRDYTTLQQLLHEQARQSKFRERKELDAMTKTMAQVVEERITKRVRREVTAEVTARVAPEAEARGREQATRETLITVLTARFGPLPPEIQTAINAANVETMNAWLPVAATAQTLEDVGILPKA